MTLEAASSALARAFDRALPLPPEGPEDVKPTDREWVEWGPIVRGER